MTLAEVNASIAAIQTGGQSFGLGDMNQTQASLSALIDLREKLQNEALRTAGTRPTFRAFNMSGMGYSQNGGV